MQCHNPVAFLTGENTVAFQNVSEFLNSDLNQSIKDGIGCDVCHTVTGLSQTVHTGDNLAATAEYKLYPLGNIKFGSIQNPEPNEYHASYYLPTYSSSQMCLPCHDLVVRDVEVEITFTEWNRIPGMAMSGAFPCQQCHMSEKEDGTHEHHFAGVDIDYEFPAEEDPQYNDVLNLIQRSATLSFENNLGALSDFILRDTIINIPIRVLSNTGHHLPSGTSFTRECWISIEIRSEDSNGEFIYQNGVLEYELELLDYEDPELTFFTSFLITEEGDTTHEILKATDIINYSLPGMEQRYTDYQVNIDKNINQIWIQAKLLFRPIKPFIFDEYPELQENIPIYTIDEINKTIKIID